MTFPTEEALVAQFIALLEGDRTPWGRARYTREFDYGRGRADIVAVLRSGRVIAFEAKLKDWRGALHQAYRNTCFAHQSFVLLPSQGAHAARGFLAEFEKRGVGLCYVNGLDVVVFQDSQHAPPLEPWLATEAASRALTPAGPVRGNHV